MVGLLFAQNKTKNKKMGLKRMGKVRGQYGLDETIRWSTKMTLKNNKKS
jgi:hypothetical protein